MLTGSLNILRPAEEILHRKYTKNVDQKPPEGRSNRDVENQKPKSVFAFRHSVLLPIGKENDVENQNSFFSVRCIIPLFHPPIGVYTRYFLTLGAVMDFSRYNGKIHYSAPRDIIHVDYYTAAVLHYTYMN